MTVAMAHPGHSPPVECEARPLPLWRMTRAEVRLLNIWHQRWRAGWGDIAGMRLDVGPAVAIDGRLPGPTAVLDLTINGNPVELAVPAAVIDRILHALSAPSRDALNHASLLLLLEFAGAALLDAMEQTLALPIALNDFRMETSQGVSDGLALVGALADLAFTARVAWPPDGADVLAALLGKPEPVQCSDIAIDVALRAGTTRLAIGVLASLVSGDVVIFDKSAHADDRIAVLCGERRLAFASLQGARVTLTTGLMPITSDMHRTWTGADLSIMNDDLTSPPELDDIEITLLFEIGRLTMPLGELRTLAAGHIIDLGRDPKGAVEILTGGKRIGNGEVVQIGDAIGVRVLRIFDRD